MHLDPESFHTVVRHTPLVAIDLLVLDPDGRMLVGRRTNHPAKGTWFAPGGRIRKGETLDAAFARITRAELGVHVSRADAELVGVYDHLYEEDFTGATGTGAHYVVLAHVLRVDSATLQLPPDQHDGYRWVGAGEGRDDASIHLNTRVYFDAV